MNELTNCEIDIVGGDGEFVVSRIRWGEDLPSSLLFSPALERPAPASLAKLERSYALRGELDPSWAARPVEFVKYRGRPSLLIEDRGGKFLDKVIDGPMAVPEFLRVASGIAKVLGCLHANGLVHRDIKPANVIVDMATGEAWLTGFGLASRLPRQRQAPEPPEVIAGTLAYMAPEQTGRMNRSIDSRSDLYSLGVTYYEMLVGGLPFTAGDAMEWIHCHIARLPVSPCARANGIPGAISAIVMKLLAKSAEERFQTATGVEADLRYCLSALEAHGQIESFSLGACDVPDRLLVSEKLYGREEEIELLLASFGRVVGGGRPELVLVSGYSGVGKSSVVNELHKPLVPPRGHFASGKFDQYKRDIPYATLAQAFQSLIRPILAKNEEELGRWRDAIREALGPNGQLVVDLVPELKLIIGEQPPVPELPPQDAQRRFQMVFRRFISAFTRDHPLALFLDDLQWLDAATLDLMEDLLTHPDVKDLLLIGAYRDNEVAPAHPLMRKLQTMRQAEAIVHDIVLAPLTRDDLEELIADSLHCERGRAGPLAGLVEEKTTGNPFFAIQFISALFEEGLLIFDHIEGQWSWDLNRIHAKGYTDNVVDLMVGKLKRLPIETQKALQQLACLGNSADFAMLRMVYQDSSEEMHGQLWEAVRTGLIFRSEDSYRFLHDRVQEAAYSLIPQESRAEAHLRIGMLMASHIPPDKLEEGIFEIVNQLNRGSHLITSIAEHERIAELNLIAGRRAKLSTAYASALKYLRAGRGLLTDETWNGNYGLAFPIEYLLAACEMLTADTAAAENRLSILAERAKSDHDIVLVTCLRQTLYELLDRSDRSVEVFIEYQRGRGRDWSPHPTDEEVSREYDQIWSLLGARQIEELVALPLITNPDVLDVLDVLTATVMSANFTDENLLALLLCRMVSLSLEHGNSDAACFAYVSLGMIAGPQFGNYEAGFQFGKLGYDLVEKRGLHRYQARTYLRFGNCVIPWKRHVKTGRELVRRAFDAANRIGDLTFAGYSCNNLNTNLLAAGDPLAEVQREAETGLEFAEKVRFGRVIIQIKTQLALIRTLRGLKPKFGSFNDDYFDELQFERHFSGNPVLALPECWYWIRKLQGRFFAGDHSSAIQASLNAKRLLWTSHSYFEVAEYHFYSALARAGAFDSATEGSRQEHFKALADHHKQLAIWAENCRENFENRAALVGAEIARIEGRDRDSLRLYEQAIRSAHANGFVHNEAVAHESAAQYYLARDLETAGYAHLRNARNCYDRWGADGKVQQLDRLYPYLADPEGQRPASLNATIGTPVGQLDAETVARASQALSGEIVLPKLIERLMRIAVEHAGAERGLLILLRGSEPLIEAEATTGHGRVDVHVRQTDITASDLPKSALHYVIRTRERVVLDDASVRNSYSDDEYLEQRKAKSVLYLPIVKQTKLIGVLYLENNLTPHVFTSDRVVVLDMLASQAAISLENARLYAALEQENLERKWAEEELRRSEAYLAEAQKLSCTGSFGWSVATDEHFWSDETYRIFEYEVSSKVSLQMVRERIHPEDIPLLAQVIARATNGDGFDYECRLLLPSGAVKQIHVVAHAVRGEFGTHEFVGAVMDITVTRQAEAALRQAHAELAHVTRVTTMGELAASIAHEVNQPIAGIVLNGNASLRWLARVKEESSDLKEARQTIQRIIRDGNRAGEILGRIRALFKKAEPAKEPLDLNEAIREILLLARSEMNKHQVALCLELAEDLPPALGDKVQLQQVILNLILNGIEAMNTVEDHSRDLIIRTQCSEEGVVTVTVRDSGIGLDSSSMGKVFAAFHTTKPGGLGMGLSISRSIVENHHGRLWVTAHDGPGVSFHFTLLTA
jgi:predicted ATPase/signal transduction histidine kinase